MLDLGSMIYALAVFGGAVLLAVGAVTHPVLAGDGAAQLALIAATPGWRVTHLVLAFGLPLVLGGWLGILLPRGVPATPPVRAAVSLAVIGYGLVVADVLFMAGAGTTLAETYRLGTPGLAATRAVFAYDMLHPAALLAGRVGAFAIGLATLSGGLAVLGQPIRPAWLGWAGVAAGLVGAALAVVTDEANARQVLAGVGLATVWQVGLALARLRERAPAV